MHDCMSEPCQVINELFKGLSDKVTPLKYCEAWGGRPVDLGARENLAKVERELSKGNCKMKPQATAINERLTCIIICSDFKLTVKEKPNVNGRRIGVGFVDETLK